MKALLPQYNTAVYAKHTFVSITRVEDRSNQAVESSIVPPPAPPPSKTSQQGEERENDSSEPNSPQPDDSFSSRDEQQPEEGRGVFLPSGGGQLYTWMCSKGGKGGTEGGGERGGWAAGSSSYNGDLSENWRFFIVFFPSFLIFLLSLLPSPFSLLPLPSSLLPLLHSPGMMLLDHPQNFLPGGGMMPPMMPIQSKGLSSDGQPNSPPPPHGEELKKLLLQQLEYYFSKDNLSSDKYLCTSSSPSFTFPPCLSFLVPLSFPSSSLSYLSPSSSFLLHFLTPTLGFSILPFPSLLSSFLPSLFSSSISLPPAATSQD